MFMFTALSIKTKDTNKTIWEELSPASPNSCRVLSLILGKETDNWMKDQYKTIYFALICTRMKYGISVYGQSSDSKLKIIQTQQN